MRNFAGAIIATSLLLPAYAMAEDKSVQPTIPQTAVPQGIGSGKPANICQELVAFVRQPVASLKAVETPSQLATAVTAKKSAEPAEKPSAPGAPQNTSGMSGQITASGPGAAGPQGAAQNKEAPVGSTATASGPAKDVSPAAPAALTSPKPSPENIQQVEIAAGINDIQGCRAISQTMRRAGIALPAPLLALAAMSPKLLEAAARP